jgi:hypothetical protein
VIATSPCFGGMLAKLQCILRLMHAEQRLCPRACIRASDCLFVSAMLARVSNRAKKAVAQKLHLFKRRRTDQHPSVQLLEYDHYQRMSAAKALAHPWLAPPGALTAPLARAGRAVADSFDNAVGAVIDGSSFASMRQSLSEAELYSALADSDEEARRADKTSTHTVSWWQNRAVRVPLLLPACLPSLCHLVMLSLRRLRSRSPKACSVLL